MSIVISRRKFLTFAAVGAGTYGLWRFGVPLLEDEGLDPKFVVGDYDRRVDNKGRVGLVSAKAELLRSWDVPLKAHSVWQNKARPWQIMAIEKDGYLAAVIDVQSDLPPRIIKSPEGTRFYGHGFFSDDGTLVYISAQEEKRKGLILIYDSIGMHLLSTIDSNGYRPHDLQVDVKNPNNFLIVNAGTPKYEANVSWFSLSSGKVVKEIHLDQPHFAPAHIWQRPNGEVYFTGSDNKSTREEEKISFSMYQPGKEILQVVSPAWNLDLKGETLNAYFDDANNRIWLTLTVSNVILVLDKSTLGIVKKIRITERPRSMVEIEVEGRRILSVSYFIKGTEDGLQTFFDLQTLERIKDMGSPKNRFYSIHSYPFHSAKKA